jgi:hypothetical protein
MLTQRQRWILSRLRDEDEELVYERGQGFVCTERVGRTLVMNLLRLMAIRADQHSNIENGGLERYTINETGLKLLAAEEKREPKKGKGK